MSNAEKKILSFPKMQKKIRDFVTDETGSLTTKSAMIVGATGLVLLGASEALGMCNVSPKGHFNGTNNGHYNGSGTFGAKVINVPSSSSCVGENTSYSYDHGCSPLKCTPISGVVNGHYNITPTCTSTVLSTHCNHISSGSGGDGSGDSCG